MKQIVRCISEGGIFVDGWGRISINLGGYDTSATYITQNGKITKQLLSQAELMEHSLKVNLEDSKEVDINNSYSS